MQAKARSIRITPKKLNLVAEMVRRRDAREALEILSFTPKKAAKILYKALKSAVANAENNFKQDSGNLYVQEVIVGKAPTMKRWIPASRGRMQPRLKRNAHLHIIIGVKPTEETSKPAGEETKKKAAKPAKKVKNSKK